MGSRRFLVMLPMFFKGYDMLDFLPGVTIMV